MRHDFVVGACAVGRTRQLGLKSKGACFQHKRTECVWVNSLCRDVRTVRS